MNSNRQILGALNPYFDQIYILTLPHAQDRQESVKMLMDGLNWRFFYGVDKEGLSMERVIKQGIYDDGAHRRTKRTHRSMTLPEVACALSHRAIYQDAVDNQYEKILIFEDDVLPCYDKLEYFPDMIGQLPKDWDLIMFGYYGEKRSSLKSWLQQQIYKVFRQLHLFNWHIVNKRWLEKLCMVNYSTDFFSIGKVLGTHAYAVNVQTAKNFIEYQTPIKLQADRVFNYYLSEYDLKAFAPKQPLFTLSALSKISQIQT